MRALSTAELLTLWELGIAQSPAQRAFSFLAVACADETLPDQLPKLGIGQRDERLLALRERTFGSQLAAVAVCPACREQLELRISTADIHTASPSDHAETIEFEHAGYKVRSRLPNSLDVVEAVSAGTIDQARDALLCRCVIEARRDGGIVAPNELPSEVKEEISRLMAASDPAAEVTLSLQCPLCSNSWEALFDIGAFFWAETSAYARRLLREVDALARTYGWGEAEILGLSALRRQAYLELICS
jgi:hypothetical protein